MMPLSAPQPRCGRRTSAAGVGRSAANDGQTSSSAVFPGRGRRQARRRRCAHRRGRPRRRRGGGPAGRGNLRIGGQMSIYEEGQVPSTPTEEPLGAVRDVEPEPEAVSEPIEESVSKVQSTSGRGRRRTTSRKRKTTARKRAGTARRKAKTTARKAKTTARKRAGTARRKAKTTARKAKTTARKRAGTARKRATTARKRATTSR